MAPADEPMAGGAGPPGPGPGFPSYVDGTGGGIVASVASSRGGWGAAAWPGAPPQAGAGSSTPPLPDDPVAKAKWCHVQHSRKQVRRPAGAVQAAAGGVFHNCVCCRVSGNLSVMASSSTLGLSGRLHAACPPAGTPRRDQHLDRCLSLVCVACPAPTHTRFKRSPSCPRRTWGSSCACRSRPASPSGRRGTVATTALAHLAGRAHAARCRRRRRRPRR